MADQDGCVDLLTILRIVNQISDEQAWAICYELTKLIAKKIEKQETRSAIRTKQQQTNLLINKRKANKRQVASRASTDVDQGIHIEEDFDEDFSQGANDDDDDDDRSRGEEDSIEEIDDELILNCRPIDDLAQIHLHKSGFVHQKTLSQTRVTKNKLSRRYNSSPSLNNHDDEVDVLSSSSETSSNAAASSCDDDTDDTDSDIAPTTGASNTSNKSSSNSCNRDELIESLGVALFWALDYGIPEDQERKLDSNMEYLIIRSQSTTHVSKAKNPSRQQQQLQHQSFNSKSEDKNLSLSEIFELCKENYRQTKIKQQKLQLHHQKMNLNNNLIKQQQQPSADQLNLPILQLSLESRHHKHFNDSFSYLQSHKTHKNASQQQQQQTLLLDDKDALNNNTKLSNLNNISNINNIDKHYRQLCKQLVNDTIELSIFLDKIYTASMLLGDITTDPEKDIHGSREILNHNDHDHIQSRIQHHRHCFHHHLHNRGLRVPLAPGTSDWARLWMQVIKELRQRINFR